MNANLNMNSYYNRQYQTSGDIRRAYLANSRKAELISTAKRALANPKVWYTLFSIKVICAVICAVVLFTVIGSIEAGSLSPITGIITALAVAAVECLCFIPIGERPQIKRK
jgi:hypothetical protein